MFGRLSAIESAEVEESGARVVVDREGSNIVAIVGSENYVVVTSDDFLRMLSKYWIVKCCQSTGL